MVPVEVHGHDSRGLLPDIVDDGEFVILNPFHPHVHNLSGNAMTLEKIGQSEEPHGKEVDPDEMMDRPVVIGQLRDMKKNTVKCSHRPNCKMLIDNISTLSQKNLMTHGPYSIPPTNRGREGDSWDPISPHQISNDSPQRDNFHKSFKTFPILAFFRGNKYMFIGRK
jgi:hypothetical protein